MFFLSARFAGAETVTLEACDGSNKWLLERTALQDLFNKTPFSKNQESYHQTFGVWRKKVGNAFWEGEVVKRESPARFFYSLSKGSDDKELQLCIRYERTSKRTGKVSQEKILTCVLTLQPAAQDGVLGVMRNLLDSSVFLRKEIYAFQEVAAKKEGLEIEARKIASQKMQEEVATMAKFSRLLDEKEKHLALLTSYATTLEDHLHTLQRLREEQKTVESLRVPNLPLSGDAELEGTPEDEDEDILTSSDSQATESDSSDSLSEKWGSQKNKRTAPSRQGVGPPRKRPNSSPNTAAVQSSEESSSASTFFSSLLDD
mgnify:FL=1